MWFPIHFYTSLPFFATIREKKKDFLFPEKMLETRGRKKFNLKSFFIPFPLNSTADKCHEIFEAKKKSR
jgi:hypothetical protein